MTSHNDGLKGPRFVRYFSSIIEALKALGGSARPAEVTDWVAASLGVSDDERAELTSTGVVRFDNAVAWARCYLAKAGIIDASKRGVWTLTEKARAIPVLSYEEAYAIFKNVQCAFQQGTSGSGKKTADGDQVAPSEEAAFSTGPNHRMQVIEALMRLSPAGFEAFSQRLLRES